MVFSSGSLVTQGQESPAPKERGFLCAALVRRRKELFERFFKVALPLGLVVLVGVIATSNTSGLQPGGHSVHYKAQLAGTVNVQVNWQAKGEWI
jgi:hypothetical protein